MRETVDDLFLMAQTGLQMLDEIKKSKLSKDLRRRHDMVITAAGKLYSTILDFTFYLIHFANKLAGEEELPSELMKLAENHLKREEEFRESLDELVVDLKPSELRLMGLE